MATTFHKLTGKIEWVKLFPETIDRPGDGIPDRYIVNFYPDDRAALAATGSKLQYDKLTNSYIRPRREPQKETRDGRILEFGAPEVVNSDGSPYVGGPRSIGNGTVAELTLAVYDAGRFKGTRLEKVRILDLLEYNPEITLSEGAKEAEKTEPSTKKPKLPF